MREVIDWVDRHNKERRLSYVEFLSDEWYEAANRALKDVNTGQADLSVAYVSEKSSHCIVLANGTASVRPNVDSADIILRQTRDVTDELRQGSLSALTAIQEGLLAVEGDLGALIAAREAVAAVDKALVSLNDSEPS